MKNILLLFLSIFALSACKGDKGDLSTENKWDRNKLLSYVQYDNDEKTEVYRDEYEYNSDGSLIHARNYLDGVISGSSYRFNYEGNVRTFMMDLYPKDDNTITTYVRETFVDDSFSPDKLSTRVNYIEKEVSREEYEYDTQGREIGYKVYYFNNIDSEHENYKYKDATISLVRNIYSDGELVGKRRVKTVFFDDKFQNMKIVSTVQYQGDSNTEFTREEYTYDTMGRENGYRSFYLGNLVSEQKDYKYDDDNKELTFYIYAYNRHDAPSDVTKNKVKMVFY